MSLTTFYRILRSNTSKQNQHTFFTNAVSDGCYCTLENLHLFYRKGDYIQIVMCKSDDVHQKCRCPKHYGDGKRCESFQIDPSKIVNRSSFPYPLYSIETILKLNLTITDDYIMYCLLLDEINIINWCQRTNRLAGLFNDGLNLHSLVYFSNGLLSANTFNWLLNNTDVIKISHTDYVIDMISHLSYNRTNLLNWIIILFQKLNLNIIDKYSERALRWATTCESLDVLDWWKNSGLVLKRDDEFLKQVSHDSCRLWNVNNHYGIRWWYDNYGIDLGCNV